MLKNETHLKDEINCCKSIIRREYSNKFTYKYSLKAIKSLILQVSSLLRLQGNYELLNDDDLSCHDRLWTKPDSNSFAFGVTS